MMALSYFSIVQVQLRTWPNFCDDSAGLRPRSFFQTPRTERHLCISWWVWHFRALREDLPAM